MATKLAIAIRTQEAQARVQAASEKIAKALGFSVEDAQLAPTHKDAGIQAAMQVEAVADFLEKAADKLQDKPAAPAHAPAQARRPSLNRKQTPDQPKASR